MTLRQKVRLLNAAAVVGLLAAIAGCFAYMALRY